MDPSRRTLCQALPLIGSSLLAASRAWGADGPTDAAAQETKPIASFATPFDQMTEHTNGPNTARPIMNGVSHSGTRIEAHETVLAPGAMPHPPHHHVHEELFLVSKGTLEVTIAGNSTTIGPGSAAFIHSGEEHGVRNIGQDAAQYFVVAIGSES
jgi:quercetin dioxygenase-like cupin family protein